MNNLTKKLEEILSHGRECQWIEFKLNYDGSGKLHEYIAEYIYQLFPIRRLIVVRKKDIWSGG